MSFKRKLIILLLLAALIALSVIALPEQDPAVKLYDKLIYYPFQSARVLMFGLVPFSVGDVLYVLGGAMLLLTFVRWLYFLSKFGAYKERLGSSLLNTVNTALFVYLFFVLGWGANYNKPPLAVSWGLATPVISTLTEQERKAKDMQNATGLASYLAARLNATAPLYRTLPYRDVNERAKAYYRVYTNSKVKKYGLEIKPTLFGFFMERMAVEGYYDPFTGEGQVNTGLPAFIMPFVVSHEMAHQAGIAAEGDANLMAYALGTAVSDPTFQYSAYLNLWLYASNRLRRRDSEKAKEIAATLNPLTKAHIDTLNEIDLKYHNEMARYTSDIYDGYLKMQQQKDGIRSYGSVAAAAWQLEQKRRAGKMKGLIKIP